jgi:two-component sensor histidine kinase
MSRPESQKGRQRFDTSDGGISMVGTASLRRTQHRTTRIAPPPGAPDAAQEMNHRVANSLQLLSAMVASDVRTVTDPVARQALEQTRARILAIAGVHRRLHLDSGTAHVDLRSYLLDLVGQLSDTCPAHRRLSVRADALRVPAGTATAIGMLVSELVTNACKHAYPPDQPGDIRIALTVTRHGGYGLIVEDRGGGRPTSTGRPGLGQRLIDSVVGQLGASATWEDARPGTRFRMECR